MLGESRLNVYILGDSLTARQHERIQAQVQTCSTAESRRRARAIFR